MPDRPSKAGEVFRYVSYENLGAKRSENRYSEDCFVIVLPVKEKKAVQPSLASKTEFVACLMVSRVLSSQCDIPLSMA